MVDVRPNLDSSSSCHWRTMRRYADESEIDPAPPHRVVGSVFGNGGRSPLDDYFGVESASQRTETDSP
jgi:hypothetical protein